ncbi:MAG: M67 family metallopeptidase [Proteobacteria bacterium]|nr:M67 family metallopeptidase [Desulfobulbaceae bacterium]MBU4154164.1 M67 family metallopeptidase [Pseudomonadota bacterium]MDP2105597.1 M67 family metallopeptidase [Desulfobulbaceae bacterium]
MLKITSEIWAALVRHAQNGLPHEVCGYLAEKEGRVVVYYEMTNTDAAHDHFSMKPEEQFKAVKDMRQKGLVLRAVYHSHPETPARPSQEDIKLAYDPQLSYVIISLAETDPVIRSFRINKGEVAEEPLERIDA